MAEEFVCSVDKENKLGYYRLHTIWSDDIFKINVASKDGAWTGQVPKDNLQEINQNKDIPRDQFIADSKETLSTAGGKEGMVYAVEDNKFVWKALDQESGIKIRLGAVPLEPANFVETIQNMMHVSLEANKGLHDRVSQLVMEKGKADENVKTALRKLEEFEKSKETTEDELFTAFVALLNTKKKKIAELEKDLIKSKVCAANLSKKKRGLKPVKTQEDPYNVDTDEDEVGPSTSKSPRREAYKTVKGKKPEAAVEEKGTKKGRQQSYKKRKPPDVEEDVPNVDISETSEPCPSRFPAVETIPVDVVETPTKDKDSDATISDDELLKVTNNSNILSVPTTWFGSKSSPTKKAETMNTSSNVSVSNRSTDFLDNLLGGPLSPDTNGNGTKSPTLLPVGRSRAKDIIDEFF